MPWPIRGMRASRTRRPGGSRTRRLLAWHLIAIPVASVVSLSALLISYRGVQISAGEMRNHGAPAVQGVAATQLALLRAHQEAQYSVDEGIDGVVGTGARYENQLSAAGQGLSRLSDVQIDGDRGRGVLETVNGLLTSYSSSITPGAVKYVSDEDELMQQEKFKEAETILSRRGTGVVPRLGVLQQHQMNRIEAVSSMGTLRRTGWAIAELGLLITVLAISSALWLLRSRCGRSFDPCLLVSLVAAVALAVFPLWATTITQHRLDTARGGLVEIERTAREHSDLAESQQRATAKPTHAQQAGELKRLAESQRDITETSTNLRTDLAAQGWQSLTYYGALSGSALIVLLPAVGIGRRLNADYWRAG
ncbi:hypothetical protein ABZ826_14840 [Streptomyces sp. NPDC047515]|uniref:hypothetical protein n=1 Tax=Streptomyces sp. NPDC047515 TaxID=3155380 RepID=UPI00340106D6